MIIYHPRITRGGKSRSVAANEPERTIHAVLLLVGGGKRYLRIKYLLDRGAHTRHESRIDIFSSGKMITQLDTLEFGNNHTVALSIAFASHYVGHIVERHPHGTVRRAICHVEQIGVKLELEEMFRSVSRGA